MGTGSGTAARQGWRRAAVALVAAGIAATSACSASDDSADGTTTIRLGAYAASGSDFEKTLNGQIKEFENANPTVKIKLEVAPYADFFKRLATQVAGGNAPDLWLSDGVLVPQYAARGALADLSGRIDDATAANTLGLDLVRDADGKVYGFPQGAQTPALYYNKKLFDDARVPYPTADWTYQDLADAAKKLTKDTNGDGKTDQWGFRAYSSGFTETWWVAARAFGSDIVTDGNRKVAVDNGPTRSALNWLHDAVYTDKFAPDPTITEGLGGPHNLFPKASVAMIFGIYARSGPANAAGVNFDVAPLPKGPAGRGEVAIINSWVINKKAPQAKADAAWKWISWYASPEVQRGIVTTGEAVPINKELASSPEYLNKPGNPANRKVFVDALGVARDVGVNAVWEEYTTAINEEFTKAMSNAASVDESLTRAQQRAQEAIDRFYAKK